MAAVHVFMLKDAPVSLCSWFWVRTRSFISQLNSFDQVLGASESYQARFFEWENSKDLTKYKTMNSAAVAAALKDSNYLTKWVD
jgi:hypothetical protein